MLLSILNYKAAWLWAYAAVNVQCTCAILLVSQPLDPAVQAEGAKCNGVSKLQWWQIRDAWTH